MSGRLSDEEVGARMREFAERTAVTMAEFAEGLRRLGEVLRQTTVSLHDLAEARRKR